ncbi:hypothetical protein Tco_1508571 [Tanacetum coccineum]
MEPAAAACASIAGLTAASLVVILDNLSDMWADVIFGVSIRPANNTVWYRSCLHKFTLCLWQFCRLGVGDRRRYMGFNMERILSTLMVLSTLMFQGVLIFVSRISLLRVMMMWISLQFFTGFNISWVMSYKGVWILVYVVLGIKSSTLLQLLSAAVLSYYFLQQINTASSRLTTVDRVTTAG